MGGFRPSHAGNRTRVNHRRGIRCLPHCIGWPTTYVLGILKTGFPNVFRPRLGWIHPADPPDVPQQSIRTEMPLAATDWPTKKSVPKQAPVQGNAYPGIWGKPELLTYSMPIYIVCTCRKRLGGVAKLVIALACQAGDRGFEPRRSRRSPRSAGGLVPFGL